MSEIMGADVGDNSRATKVKMLYSSQPRVLVAAGIQIVIVLARATVGRFRGSSGVTTLWCLTLSGDSSQAVRYLVTPPCKTRWGWFCLRGKSAVMQTGCVHSDMPALQDKRQPGFMDCPNPAAPFGPCIAAVLSGS